MNKIEAINIKNEEFNSTHWSIHIDGEPLDKILHKLTLNKELIGLVPTLLDWLEDKKERKVVWDRIQSHEKQIVPILMCPDDVDLWCTIVNVEIEKKENTVKWLRLGIDNGSSENMPNSIGTSVNWFSNVGPYEFKKDEYQKVISIFKFYLEKDELKKKIHYWIDRIENSHKIPEEIKAFNFGIIESENEYKLYLNGAKEYDLKNDDWACDYDFTPNEKYLSLGLFSKKLNWEEIESLVKYSIEEFIEIRISPLTFVHRAEYLTTGFDEGDLIQIK